MTPEERHAKRLETINKKGWDVAQALIEIKANKDVKLEDLSDLRGGKPGETAEERCRRFLNQINAARTRLQTHQFGDCEDCGEAIPDAALDQMPWMTQCSACAARGTSFFPF